MKTKSIVAGFVTLAAALITYHLIKKRNRKKAEPVHQTRHLTDLFSTAKNYVK